MTLLTGCGKNDSVTQAEKKDVATGVSVPSIAETKAIAEEGFIYGLPIVMNYAVMYAYSVDRNSGQFKAPFNEISNEARVFRGSGVLDPNRGYRGQQAQHLENLGIEDTYIMRLRNQASVAAGV